MNTDTREIRDVRDISADEMASGKWIPVAKRWAKKYERKQPVTDADFARIVAAEQRRKRRAAKRLSGAR